MMLVDYSDSESESEKQKKQTLPPPLQRPKPGGLSGLLPKPRGARGNTREENGPKKIIVNLPKPKHDLENGPPTKKARVGGGSGLSAMLPAPKRSGTTVKNAPPPPPPPPPPPTVWETKNPSSETIIQTETGDKAPTGGSGFVSVASSTRFVPQSVARKPIQPASTFKRAGGTGGTTRPATAKPKVSLFGSGGWHPYRYRQVEEFANIRTGPSLTSAKPTTKATFTGEYQPIMLTTTKPANRPKGMSDTQDGDSCPEEATATPETALSARGHNGPQDLETIAREAGLDDAAVDIS